MNVWTLLVSRRAVLFRCRDAVSRWRPAAQMEPFPFLAGLAGALVGGLQNIGSGVLASLCDVAANRSGQPGVVDDLNGIVDPCCAQLPLATRMSHQGQPFKLTSPQHRHQLHGRTMLLYQITHHPHMRCGVRIKR